MPTKRNKARAKGQTAICFPLPEVAGHGEASKAALQERAEAVTAQKGITVTMSTLIRLAVAYQEKRGWKDIPEVTYSK